MYNYKTSFIVYEMKYFSFRTLNLFLALCIGLLFIGKVAAVSPVESYHDITLNSTIYSSIEYLTEKEVINGYNDGTFGPDKPINRAEALKIIILSAGEEFTHGESGFTDVPNDAWFAPYVSYAKSQGIVKGDPSGNFSPGRQVNKAEFIKMVLEAFRVDLSEYTIEISVPDAPTDQWFSNYVRFAAQFHIIDLDGLGNANPGTYLTRGESAEIIYRTLKSGQGLDPQVTLELAERHLVYALQILQNKEMVIAGLSVSAARKFIEALSFIARNPVVIAATDTTDAVQSLIGAYIAAENGLLNDVILAAKNAWSIADKIEASEASEGLKVMALSIKDLAKGIADRAREVKGNLPA